MSYIASYGTALPHFRIEENTLYPKAKKLAHRSICFSDEDIITLSFEATKECLSKSNEKPQAVFFATSTPIFFNRYHAAFIGDLLGLNDSVFALDFVNSHRSGSDALLIANELVNAQKYSTVLVIAADVKYPKIGEESNTSFGHAACAFLLSSTNTGIEITKTDSIGSHIAEEYAYKENAILLDPRFSRDAGFKTNMTAVAHSIRKNTNQPNKIILNSNYSRIAGPVFTQAGFIESQFSKDSLTSKIGNSGSTHALLQLLNEIENGEKNITVVDYTNGSNLITVFSDGSPNSKTFQKKLTQFEFVKSYQDYLLLRKAGNFGSMKYATSDMFSSEMMYEREKISLTRLVGYKCSGCGTSYFLKTLRCKRCKSEKFDPINLADKGKVYSFTAEHYFPVSFPPIYMCVIDLEGGGRITVQQTDTMYPENNKIEIGSKIKLVLRKMIERDKKPNYYFKAIHLT